MANIRQLYHQKVKDFGHFIGLSGGDPDDPRKPFDLPIPFSCGEISEIEQSIGHTLPVDYEEFLTLIGGGWFPGYVGTRPIETRGNYVRELIQTFYGCKEETGYTLMEAIRVFSGRIPTELIPFGANAFGDQMCLGIKGRERGNVFLWNHEDERSDEDYWDIYGAGKPVPREWSYGNVTLVAKSFEDFFSRLEKITE